MLGNIFYGMTMAENPTKPLEPFRYHVRLLRYNYFRFAATILVFQRSGLWDRLHRLFLCMVILYNSYRPFGTFQIPCQVTLTYSSSYTEIFFKFNNWNSDIQPPYWQNRYRSHENFSYFLANAVSGKVTKAHNSISNRSGVVRVKVAWESYYPQT